MSQSIVLKLGGSVLHDELQMRAAVHEIYRWRRAGYSLLAVVSALTGKTDQLLAKCARLYTRRAPRTEAAVAALGEMESAALLGLHLDRAGIPACVRTPDTIGLRATGPALDATPGEVDSGRLRRTLRRFGTIVVPGYLARGPDDEIVVFGRGGSDLSALVLARALGNVRCRLIKDVEGLFDRDPKQPQARLYAQATYESALATDGSILQHKAIRYAREHGLSFEVARPNGFRETIIGSQASTYRAAERPSAPLQVTLLGHGTVGAGVRELIENLPSALAVTDVVVRDPDKHPVLRRQGVSVDTDPQRAAACGGDVVVELMGGTDDAADAVIRALANGKHVVTANKTLLAMHGPALQATAARNGVQLLSASAVGGAMPIVEAIRRRHPTPLRSIRAVLNGTANFVLNAVAAGSSFPAALSTAVTLGFAEQDPTRDLTGSDAADKLTVLAQEAALEALPQCEIPCDVLRESSASPEDGGTLRQVATLLADGDQARGSVRLESVAPEDPLFALADEENAACLVWADDRACVVRGAGAGRWPTAEAVIADLLALERTRRRELNPSISTPLLA